MSTFNYRRETVISVEEQLEAIDLYKAEEMRYTYLKEKKT